MVFFVVVPIVFGFFANFFIPYHIGSKDVAFPRLNNLGFWLFPAGYILVAKPAFLRPSVTKYFDKPSFFYKLVSKNNYSSGLNTNLLSESHRFSVSKKPVTYQLDSATAQDIFQKNFYTNTPLLFLKQSLLQNNFLNFWEFSTYIVKERRKKIVLAKCPNSILTMSGWTFITPFSGNLRFTGSGAQDVAILSVLLAGLSTTISFTNLLITRRTLSMPGLRNRRVLVPFISITLFLVMRMLALITPVLGAAMIMLAFDRH
jgi:heme/copper-type cytochrome/quinol oxidase subunit 1